MTKNKDFFTYKFVFSYDGSRFFGSARQPNKYCVQNALENALRCVGVFHPTLFASRTDKGVHAKSAVAKVFSPYELNISFVKNKLNHELKGIFIKDIRPLNFEPRFDAKMRSYRYIITQNQNAFNSHYAYFYPKKIDFVLLKEGLELFCSEHDFAGFCLSQNEAKSTRRQIFKTRLYQHKNYIVFNFFANGFLRGQIRLMMAALLKLNEGKISLKQLKEQIDLKKIHSRTLADASGLYLKSIVY